jgi:hypothetical protein
MSIQKYNRRAGIKGIGLLVGGAALAPGMLFSSGCASLKNKSWVNSPKLPEGEPVNADYELKVNGITVPVLNCRVSSFPLNQVWPGYQRPLDQTEIAGFASWDMAGPVTVEVISKRTIETAKLLPSTAGSFSNKTTSSVVFKMDKPGQVVVEINGMHRALHLFANAKEKEQPNPSAAGLRYFGPGIHDIGRTTLNSNESVYIAAGAIVYGCFYAEDVTNIRISGRGVLDVSKLERDKGNGAVRLLGCTNVVVEDIIMRDPDQWCLNMFGCKNVHISNIKMIGLWRYNADGLDVCNSENVVVENSFVRSFDDALVVKGIKWKYGDRPVKNVKFSNCTVWCDWGKALEIGAETVAPEISDIVFEGCNIIHASYAAIDILHGDAAKIRNIVFENIHIELDGTNYHPQMQANKEDTYKLKDTAYSPRLLEVRIVGTDYSQDKTRGFLENVVFKNIFVKTGSQKPESLFHGFDEVHRIKSVSIQNLQFNGTRIQSVKEANIHTNAHVDEIQLQ